MEQSEPEEEYSFGASLEELSAKKIADLIREELDHILQSTGLSQESLAIEMEYADQSSVSRMLGRPNRNLPAEKAILLDAKYETLCGLSFTDLVKARQAADRRARSRRASADYDVFVASPMASADDYGPMRGLAGSLVSAIENHTDLRVYFAGRSIATDEDFESTDIAWRVNRDALQSSRCFLLYLPEKLSKPSSVWVEAGMALALQIPSLYFVTNPESLPYILQRAAQPGRSGGSEVVTTHYIGDKKQEPHRLVRLHKRELFADYL